MDVSVSEYLWWDDQYYVRYRRKAYKKSRNMNRAFQLWLYRTGGMLGKSNRETKRYSKSR